MFLDVFSEGSVCAGTLSCLFDKLLARAPPGLAHFHDLLFFKLLARASPAFAHVLDFIFWKCLAPTTPELVFSASFIQRQILKLSIARKARSRA